MRISRSVRQRAAFPATLLALCLATQAVESAPITFEDLGSAGDGIVVPPGYSGLVWENFRALNVQQELLTYGSNGYTNGVQSGVNVGFNFLGAPATIKSAGGFDVTSLFASAAWNTGLRLTITASRNAATVFSNVYTLSTQSATQIVLDLDDITSLRFSAAGGSPSGFNGSGTHFAIDDINIVLNSPTGTGGGTGTVSDVPIPAALPLFCLGLAGLGMFRKNRNKI